MRIFAKESYLNNEVALFSHLAKMVSSITGNDTSDRKKIRCKLAGGENRAVTIPFEIRNAQKSKLSCRSYDPIAVSSPNFQMTCSLPSNYDEKENGGRACSLAQYLAKTSLTSPL